MNYFDDFCKRHDLDQNSAYALWSYKCYLEGAHDTILLFDQKFDCHLDQEGCCDDCPVMFGTIEDIKDDLDDREPGEEEEDYDSIYGPF